MSKALVYKGLSLLQDDAGQNKPQKRKNVDSSEKKHKQKQKLQKQNFDASQITLEDKLKHSAPVDRTEENLKILQQLKALKPKASAVQKVLELYTKPTNSLEESTEKVEKQRSILFDDEDDDKDKKKRKKKKYDVDSW